MTTTATKPNTQALRRVDAIVGRAQAGRIHVAVAMRMVETFAPALPVRVYDVAVDAIAEAAETRGQSLDINTAEIDRPRSARVDSATRRARRHARKTHRASLVSGQSAPTAHNVTAATPWRMDAGVIAAESLRPVWAVSADGTVADAARVFATLGVGRSHDVTLPDRTCRVPSLPVECLPAMASGKALGLTVPALTAADRRRGVRMLDALALAQDSDKAEQARRVNAYQRNGWAH